MSHINSELDTFKNASRAPDGRNYWSLLEHSLPYSITDKNALSQLDPSISPELVDALVHFYDSRCVFSGLNDRLRFRINNERSVVIVPFRPASYTACKSVEYPAPALPSGFIIADDLTTLRTSLLTSLLLFPKTVYADPLTSIYNLDVTSLREDELDTEESIDCLKEQSIDAT